MFLTGKKILCVKEEVTYGSDPTPTVGSNAIEAEQVVDVYEGEVLERDQVRGNLSPEEPVLGKRNVKLTFKVEVKGSGSAGTAPRLGDLLEACGFAETVAGGVAVSYAPSSTTMKSVTFYLYELQDSGSCILKKIKGARGSFQLNAEAGKLAYLTFTFFGLYETPADAAVPSAPTFSEPKAEPVLSSAAALNGVTSLVIQGMSLDMQNNVVARDDINAATGISQFAITGRKPTGKLNPDAVLLATFDFWADWAAATARSFSMMIGATAGRKCLVSVPKLTIDSVETGDREGGVTRELPFRASGNSGNDEVSFIFS